MAKKRVLIICTGNSARSQMAEALLRFEGGDAFDVFSAGTNPAANVRPEAVAVLQEINIDISAQHSKSVSEFAGQRFDFVITVCDQAREDCPVFAGEVTRLHWPFEDPALVLDAGKERLYAFRKLRDKIHSRVIVFVAESARGYLW